MQLSIEWLLSNAAIALYNLAPPFHEVKNLQAVAWDGAQAHIAHSEDDLKRITSLMNNLPVSTPPRTALWFMVPKKALAHEEDQQHPHNG